MNRLLRSAFLSVMLLVMALPAFGESKRSTDRQSVETTVTVLDRLLAQGEPIVAIEITDIQLEQTETGFTLLLETNGNFPVPETVVRGNAAIANLPNAVLNLSEGEDFFASSPADGIALVSVSALPDNRVQIAVTGADAPPAVDFQSDTLGLMAIVEIGKATAQTSDDDAIQLSVTGEQIEDNYSVPDASTATRTNTRTLDTPQSVQVVPQQVLEDQQILRVDDALRNVSGITGSLDYTSDANINIRGFNAADGFSNGSVLQDGFRINSNFSTEDTANVERVEVIKGPSSVLYGQSDPGGIINLVSKRPLAFPFYEVEVQGGSFGLFRPSVDLSGPLAEDGSLSYRLNAAYQIEDDFRDFDVDRERFLVAPVLSWDISDRTNLTLLLEYNQERTPANAGTLAFEDGVLDIRDRIVGEPDDFFRNRFLSVGYDLTHQFNEDWTLNHGFRYVNQDYRTVLTLPVAFDETTGEVTRFFAERDLLTNDYTFQTNVVGEFETGSVQHQLLAGIDLNFNRLDELTKFDTSTPTPLNIFDPVYGAVDRPNLDDLEPFPGLDSETNQAGVYLQDQITLSDQFILVGSLRYDIVNQINLSADNPNRLDQALSPRMGVVYQPVENISLYANYSQSFNQNSGQTANGNPLEAERGRGYEVGAKGEFGDISATLAYFDITKENVSTTDPENLFFTVATGEQRSQGVELDVAGEILPGWNIIANYAYIDARITEDETNPVGNRLFNSPQNSANLWTTYEIQTGDLQGLSFGMGVNYVGSRFGDQANSFKVDDYFLTNAALFYKREEWKFGLNFNNLFDTNYISSTGNSRTFGNVVGTPFSIVGSVSVQF